MWLAVLFFVLGQAADQFFCPALEVIADKLNMSHEIAGITVLALGNGAPDVSSTFAAIVNQGDFSIAIGEVFGAGLFLVTVVVSAVAFVGKHIKMDVHSFMRGMFWLLKRELMTFRHHLLPAGMCNGLLHLVGRNHQLV